MKLRRRTPIEKKKKKKKKKKRKKKTHISEFSGVFLFKKHKRGGSFKEICDKK